MLKKLYELWSTETQVFITVKSVHLKCVFVAVIESIYKTDTKVLLEFGDNSIEIDITENYVCSENEMIITCGDTTVKINWEVEEL